MRCSGCGKNIPFAGSVCPYCHRDKSRDQTYTVLATVLGCAGVWGGAELFGFWGGVGGLVIGGVAAAGLSGVTKKSEAPEVRLGVGADVGTRLAQLESLKEKGLITEAEFDKRRGEILASI